MEYNETLPQSEGLTDTQVTYLASEALFFLYGQKTLPQVEEMVQHIAETTGHDPTNCQQVVNRLIDKSFLMLQRAEMVFGTNGLWFLENSYMHGEEIDSLALAERILSQSRFFD